MRVAGLIDQRGVECIVMDSDISDKTKIGMCLRAKHGSHRDSVYIEADIDGVLYDRIVMMCGEGDCFGAAGLLLKDHDKLFVNDILDFRARLERTMKFHT